MTDRQCHCGEKTNLGWCCEHKGCLRERMPDWTIFNDCFPRGIKMGDGDGFAEVGHWFLMAEWKHSKNVSLPEGQRKALRRFGGRPGRDAALCLRGTPDDLQWLVFDGGVPDGWQDVSLEDVKAWVKRWADDADTNPHPWAAYS